MVATISVQFTESVVWVNFKQGLYPTDGDSSFIPTGNTVLGFLVAIPFLLIAIGLTSYFSKRKWLKFKVWQWAIAFIGLITYLVLFLTRLMAWGARDTAQHASLYYGYEVVMGLIMGFFILDAYNLLKSEQCEVASEKWMNRLKTALARIKEIQQ